MEHYKTLRNPKTDKTIVHRARPQTVEPGQDENRGCQTHDHRAGAAVTWDVVAVMDAGSTDPKCKQVSTFMYQTNTGSTVTKIRE